jgi:carbonic anhydrase
MIGCSDSRADPAILTNTRPGDLFIVRNVAGIVPPYTLDSGHHGTSAAIEFAVKALSVKDIVVMGHSMCGGVRALAERDLVAEKYEFLPSWVDIVNPALKAARQQTANASPEEARRALEQAVILVSLKNLLTFPWIKQGVAEGRLQIHGWYFDMTAGRLLAYDEGTKTFVDVHARERKRAP